MSILACLELMKCLCLSQMINDPRVSTHSPPTSANDSEREDTPVKLLYSKSKVYVHPSNNVDDFIPGYMSIVEKVVCHEFSLQQITAANIFISTDTQRVPGCMDARSTDSLQRHGCFCSSRCKPQKYGPS